MLARVDPSEASCRPDETYRLREGVTALCIKDRKTQFVKIPAGATLQVDPNATTGVIAAQWEGIQVLLFPKDLEASGESIAGEAAKGIALTLD